MNEKYIKTPNNYLKDVTGVYGEGNLEMLVRDGNKLALQFKSRIEGRTRDADPTEAMRLRVHDPLWMLARQWQMGEFRGNNTGTAMSVRCIVRYGDWSSDPIEPVTEQINPRIDFLAKIESAVHFLDLMRSSGLNVKEHLPGLIQSFPIDWNALDDSLVLPDAVTSQQEHLLNRHLQNYARAYRGKIFDGEALYNHLVQGQSFLKGDSEEAETKFKAWFQKKYKPVSSDSQSWQEADLCYTVETNVAGKQFTGDRYQGGRLSWYTFDYNDNPGDKSFAVFLKNPGHQNLLVIEKIRELLNTGFEKANDIVNRAPVIIKQGITEAEAKAIQAELIALDADVEVRVPKQRTGERPRTGTRPGNEQCISFALFLQTPGPQKLQVIKKTNELLNIGLKDAKDLVDSAPVALKEGMTEAEAKAIQAELIALGAEVELIKVQRPRTGTSPRPRDEEGILFGLLLKNPGPQKLQVIKKTKELLKIGLKDAKDLVDRAPVALKEGMTEAEAKAIQSELIALGADVELTSQKPAQIQTPAPAQIQTPAPAQTIGIKPGGTEETLIRKEEVLCLPTPASFAAAPNKRLWQMEDRKVFMGNSVEEPSEANSVVMRFATMYSNDWMLFPLKTEIGQYITIERIDVIDSFGQRHTMSGNCRAGNMEQLGEYEEQWQVFVNSTVGDAKRTAINGLYYAQQLAATIEGKPVEEIKILRDEIANMVWGVENIVSDGCGGTLDANLYATQLETIVNERNKAGEPVREPDTIVFGQDSAPEVEKAASNQAPRAKFSYSLQSSVPFNWIPFIPQRLATEDTKNSPFFMGGREIILRRGKMPCYIFNGDKFDLHAVRPQSSIMRPVVTRDKNGNVLKEEPMVIHEEAVQATGIRLTKNYQRARWIGGKTYQWLGVHKRQSRTEASSGLVFDKLKEV